VDVEQAQLVRARHAQQRVEVQKLVADVAKHEAALARRDAAVGDARDDLDELVEPDAVATRVDGLERVSVPL
jgi:hypothetical protein